MARHINAPTCSIWYDLPPKPRYSMSRKCVVVAPTLVHFNKLQWGNLLNTLKVNDTVSRSHSLTLVAKFSQLKHFKVAIPMTWCTDIMSSAWQTPSVKTWLFCLLLRLKKPDILEHASKHGYPNQAVPGHTSYAGVD